MSGGGSGTSGGKRAAPRAERVLPGIWRLRLPLPWPGVPHVNCWAVASEGGIVLFDTGMGGEGRMRDFDLALAQVGLAVTDIRLLVCTHSHADHYGLAAEIVAAAGCELWLHPAWEHARQVADTSDAALERRLEIGRQSGVPAAALERYRELRGDEESGIPALAEPDRELVAGTEVATDLGSWRVIETPGHAPSHVVFHQPEQRLLISGDHLLGRTVLFFDHGHTPDPVAEFLAALDRVEGIGVDLCLSGHGRPFRDPEAKIAESRRQVASMLTRLRGMLGGGPRTAFDLTTEIVGPERAASPASAFVLQIVLCYLDHLAALGEAEPVADSDPTLWALTAAASSR